MPGDLRTQVARADDGAFANGKQIVGFKPFVESDADTRFVVPRADPLSPSPCRLQEKLERLAQPGPRVFTFEKIRICLK